MRNYDNFSGADPECEKGGGGLVPGNRVLKRDTIARSHATFLTYQ